MLLANLLACGDGALDKLLTDDFLNLAHATFLAKVNDSDRGAALTGTAGTATTVGIVLRVVGQSVVDDMGEVVYIETAGSHIGSHKQLYAALAELLHREVALLLGQFAVQCIGIVSVLYQFVGNLLCLHTGAAEDDAVDVRVVVGDTLQCQVFVLGVYHVVHMVYILRPLVLVANNNLVGIGEVVLGDTGNLLAHGSREEQCVTVARNILEDTVYAVGKAHVEHLVSLIKHYITHGREIHHSTFHEVDESARGSHDDVHAFSDIAYLVFDGGTTIHGHHAQSLHILGECGQIIGNLQT